MSAEIGNENHSCVSIDIEKPDEEIPLIISLEKELSRWPPLSENHCIYRVPHMLRTTATDGSLYNPNMVSIGPLHHGRKGLEAMEEYKQRFLIDFLGRTGLKLEDYARFIKDREARIRECYRDTIGLKSDELTEIYMVDAAFLVELLLKYDAEPLSGGFRIFQVPKMEIGIISDLILLENQLPMFILEEIFNSWIDDRIDMLSIVCRLLTFRRDMIGKGYDLQEVRSTKPVHFLDCLRSCAISAGSGNPHLIQPEAVQSSSTHSVTELHQAGLKFRKSPSSDLFSIKYEDGVLTVPYIYIGSQTETMYRNLLAFEQWHYPYKEMLFTDFVCLMDQLVNTHQDIDLLVENGIIMHTLGDSSQAANVFNGISHGLGRSYRERYFSSIYRDLNMYCKIPWNKWKANLKQKYFNTPWTGISVAAAAILLILTVIQTVFTIIN